MEAELRQEVHAFVDALLRRSGERTERNFRRDRAGALRDAPESSGLEPQKKALGPLPL